MAGDGITRVKGNHVKLTDIENALEVLTFMQPMLDPTKQASIQVVIDVFTREATRRKTLQHPKRPYQVNRIAPNQYAITHNGKTVTSLSSRSQAYRLAQRLNSAYA